MKLQELTLRNLRIPLSRPYVLSYRTFTEFEPIIVEVCDGDGRIGWGEGHIAPGSSSETREGGWAFCQDNAAAVVGKDTNEAKSIVAANMKASKVAATALLTAIEMLEDHPLLRVEREVRLPLLTSHQTLTILLPSLNFGALNWCYAAKQRGMVDVDIQQAKTAQPLVGPGETRLSLRRAAREKRAGGIVR